MVARKIDRATKKKYIATRLDYRTSKSTECAHYTHRARQTYTGVRGAQHKRVKRLRAPAQPSRHRERTQNAQQIDFIQRNMEEGNYTSLKEMLYIVKKNHTGVPVEDIIENMLILA